MNLPPPPTPKKSLEKRWWLEPGGRWDTFLEGTMVLIGGLITAAIVIFLAYVLLFGDGGGGRREEPFTGREGSDCVQTADGWEC